MFCALSTLDVPEDVGDAVQTQDNRGRKALIPERSKFITVPKGIKREREVDDDPDDAQNAKRKRGVTVSDVPSGSSRKTGSQLEGGWLSGMEVDVGGGEPSFGDVSTSTNVQGDRVRRQRLTATSQEPLFFPASQMTQADVEAFKAAGLGDAEDLEALLDDDELDDDELDNDLDGGDEINDPGGEWGNLEQGGGNDTVMEATQVPLRDDDRAFRPLFDD